MQFQHPSEEEGCFVFEVVNSPICARSQPNNLAEDKTRLEFEVGELVSVDLIQHSSDINNGPYLRLSDRSGWLFGNFMGQERMKKLTVERGLWAMYVDNVPNGQFLRRHPVVSSDLDFEVDGDDVLYEPGTKLYCDARVFQMSTGIEFYRVQGTRGWVFDHMPGVDGEKARTMLLHEDKIRFGIFCYKAVEDTVIRLEPNTSEDAMTRESIKSGEIVAVDCVRDDTEDELNGPFLRLTDGAGWLFEKKQGVTMMENVTVEVGSWVMRILNPPVGVGLRRHPIVCQDKLYPVVYPTGSMVQCDLKVVDEDNTIFYHVCGTRGWLFDRRNETMLLEVISIDNHITVSMHQPWDPNFVRGVAATVEHIKEKKQATNDRYGTLVFESVKADFVLVHIYCKTRMVAVCDEKSGSHICQCNCTTKELMALLNGDTKVIDSTQSTQQNLISQPLRVSDLAEYGDLGVKLATHDLGTLTRQEPSVGENKLKEKGALPKVEANEKVDDSGTKEEQKDQGDLQEETRHETNEQQLVTDSVSESHPDEMVLRKQLMELEMIDRETKEKRLELLKKLKSFDDARAAEASYFRQLSNERLNEMKAEEQKLAEREGLGDQLLVEIPEGEDITIVEFFGKVNVHSRLDTKSPQSYTSARTHRSSKSHRDPRKRGYQCGECAKIFSILEDREDHCREEHGIECEVCDRVFKSFRALDLHKDKESHW